MIELPLLDDEYREVFLSLLDEINNEILCSENKRPRFSKDEERLEEQF